jgi:PhnB protein
MSIQQLNPYLVFNGAAEQAIQLYQNALGAKTEGLTHFGDMPGCKLPPEQTNLVMHALLRIGGHVVMISDAPPDRPVPTEGNVHVALHYDDRAEMTWAFEALSAGGRIAMPLQDTFWGAHFGMLTDAYGINWMFDFDLKNA